MMPYGISKFYSVAGHYGKPRVYHRLFQRSRTPHALCHTPDIVAMFDEPPVGSRLCQLCEKVAQ